MPQFRVIVEDEYAGRMTMYVTAKDDVIAEEQATIAAYERGCTCIVEVEVFEIEDQ